jgi:hypothetical protein
MEKGVEISKEGTALSLSLSLSPLRNKPQPPNFLGVQRCFPVYYYYYYYYYFKPGGNSDLNGGKNAKWVSLPIYN